MLINKVITEHKLLLELRTAGVLTENQAIGTVDNGKEIYTYDTEGAMVELPESAQAVIDAHISDPQPPTAEDRISALETLVLQLGGVI